MENYMILNGVRIDFTPEQIAKLNGNVPVAAKGQELAEIPAGDTFRVGEREMIVLEHLEDGYTVAVCKDIIRTNRFGVNNNYNGSDVDEICCGFAEEIKTIVGESNMDLIILDLTSDDGLDDYGTINRYAALLTAEMYRQYVRILDKYKPEKWWWLATAYSTPTHDDASWVKCVSPSGNVYGINGVNDFGLGVRPFCIFKSSIFVS